MFLEVHSATKLISEIRKTNSEQMKKRVCCLDKKHRMIVLPKPEEILDRIRLDFYVPSQGLMAKGNVLNFHML